MGQCNLQYIHLKVTSILNAALYLTKFAVSLKSLIAAILFGSVQKGLSYHIFELEDSGLPQQGILPISARKPITKTNHRVLKKTLSTVPRKSYSCSTVLLEFPNHPQEFPHLNTPMRVA